jgi:hypothetical protein
VADVTQKFNTGCAAVKQLHVGWKGIPSFQLFQSPDANALIG